MSLRFKMLNQWKLFSISLKTVKPTTTEQHAQCTYTKPLRVRRMITVWPSLHHSGHPNHGRLGTRPISFSRNPGFESRPGDQPSWDSSCFFSVNLNSCRFRVECIHSFINSALYRGEWSASCPVRFTPGERSARTSILVSSQSPQAVRTLYKYQDSSSD